MPDWVMLTKNGLVRVDYDSDIKDYVKTEAEDPIVYLNEDCEVDSNFTISDLCRFVAGHDELKLFISRYSHIRSIDEHHAELAIAPPVRYPDGEYVKIKWVACVSGSKHASVFDFFSEIAVFGEDGFISGIGNRSICHLGNLPLKLDTSVCCQRVMENDALFVSDKKLTLLEVLHAFYWDIGFYGSPSDRDEMFSSLSQREIDPTESFEEEDLVVPIDDSLDLMRQDISDIRNSLTVVSKSLGTVVMVPLDRLSTAQADALNRLAKVEAELVEVSRVVSKLVELERRIAVMERSPTKQAPPQAPPGTAFCFDDIMSHLNAACNAVDVSQSKTKDLKKSGNWFSDTMDSLFKKK